MYVMLFNLLFFWETWSKNNINQLLLCNFLNAGYSWMQTVFYNLSVIAIC